MRNDYYYILASLILFLVLVIFTQKEEIPTTQPETGPGHPGWMEQWEQMKTLGTGNVDFDRIQKIRAQQRYQFSLRSNGLLTEVTEVGPTNVGGRTRALVVDQSNPQHLIAGGVSGGMWQSFDRGDSWEPIEEFSANLSVSDITQNPLDPSIYYYASGEPSGNSAGIPGNGIYKSTDSGQSFQQLPATANEHFDHNWRVVHSMVDSHTVFVGTDGSGLYRSQNGGDSFSVVYNEQGQFRGSAITDIEVFPDSSIMIGVSGEGIFYSPNGDPGTFESRQQGLPGSNFRRVELAYCDSFPDVIYATQVVESNDGIDGVFRSDDRGQTWDTVANPMDYDIGFGFPWYCLTLEVKPDDPDYVVIGSINMAYSTNGGEFWTETQNSHADQHIIRFDPENAGQFYVGNDGGVYRYPTNRVEFDVADLNNGFNVTQFYAGAYFPEGTDMYGGTQDNGTQSTKNANPSFTHIFGGDGAYTQINQQFPTVAYVSWQRGHIHRTFGADKNNPRFDNVMNELDGDNDNDIDDGAWFINPFEVNPADGFQVYFPTRTRVWRTRNGGDEWQPITENLLSSGRPYAIDMTEEENPTLYIGGTRGLFYRVDSAQTVEGTNAKNLSPVVPKNVTEHFIGNLTVSPTWDTVVYAALTNYSDEPRIYKITAANTDEPQWEPIHNNLPTGLPVNWVEVSPLTDSVLVAATDFGLYTTVDGGNNWTLEKDIPNVSIHQVRLRNDGKLFVFTHGRGIFTAQLPGDFSEITGTSDAPPEPVQLRVYPNPVRDQLGIQWPFERAVAQLSIYNVKGQRVRGEQVSRGQPVDVAGLTGGMYIVHLTDGVQEATTRIVKE